MPSFCFLRLAEVKGFNLCASVGVADIATNDVTVEKAFSSKLKCSASKEAH